MADDNSPKAAGDNFPTQTQVVIIGGGVIGCSTAYHLTKLGWKDVVVLERNGTSRCDDLQQLQAACRFHHG